MLMLELMTEAAKRYGSGPGWGAVVGDAGDQARHGMDAPDEVQDGMEWYADEDDPEVCWPAPRMVALRETPNVGGEARLAAHQPLQTTTATPQGVASTDQLGGRVRSEKD